MWECFHDLILTTVWVWGVCGCNKSKNNQSLVTVEGSAPEKVSRAKIKTREISARTTARYCCFHSGSIMLSQELEDACDVTWPKRRELTLLPEGPISQEMGIAYGMKLCNASH